MLKLENVGKIYSSGSNVSVGIRKVNLELKKGEFVAITGESGSGKSTLLNVLSGIDTYEEGEMYVFNEETSYFAVEDLENYRNKYVGFIFQNYNIIDSYTVLQNVESALLLNGISKNERREKAKELIKRVGLEHRMNTKASKLSGGEKQRVVIARALSKDPLIIAADEPTGNLDSKSSKEIIDLIHEIGKDKLVLIVTHDFNEVADYATRILRVYDGEIKEDRVLKPVEPEEDNVSQGEDTFDYNKPKVKEKDLLGLSINDLFSSPKRSVFYYTVIFLMSLFLLASIGAYRYLSSTTGDVDVRFNSSFDNDDPYRVVINKKDGTVFTESELNEIKNMSQVNYIVTNDIYLDESAYLSYWDYDSGEDIYISNFYNKASNISASDLTCGTLPKADNEIVITISKTSLTENHSTFDSLIGLELENSLLSDSGDKPFKVVGVIDGSLFGESQSSYNYITDSLYDSLAKEELEEYKFVMKYHIKKSSTESTDVSFEDGEEWNSFYYSVVKPDSALKKGEISCESLATGYTIDFKIESAYGTVYELDDATVKSISSANQYSYSETVYLSVEDYEAYQKSFESSYQISIFVKNSSKTESLRKELIKKGYNAVIPSIDMVTSGSISTLLKGIYFFVIAQFILESLLIIYVILLHSIKSRKDDVEILRTIGASKVQIRKMFIHEFLFIGLTVYAALLIIFFIVKGLVKGMFYSILSSITFGDFILLLLVILLINYLLSLLFSRRMFKKTVRKSLQEE